MSQEFSQPEQVSPQKSPEAFRKQTLHAIADHVKQVDIGASQAVIQLQRLRGHVEEQGISPQDYDQVVARAELLSEVAREKQNVQAGYEEINYTLDQSQAKLTGYAEFGDRVHAAEGDLSLQDDELQKEAADTSDYLAALRGGKLGKFVSKSSEAVEAMKAVFEIFDAPTKDYPTAEAIERILKAVEALEVEELRTSRELETGLRDEAGSLDVVNH